MRRPTRTTCTLHLEKESTNKLTQSQLEQVTSPVTQSPAESCTANHAPERRSETHIATSDRPTLASPRICGICGICATITQTTLTALPPTFTPSPQHRTAQQQQLQLNCTPLPLATPPHLRLPARPTVAAMCTSGLPDGVEKVCLCIASLTLPCLISLRQLSPAPPLSC